MLRILNKAHASYHCTQQILHVIDSCLIFYSVFHCILEDVPVIGHHVCLLKVDKFSCMYERREKCHHYFAKYAFLPSSEMFSFSSVCV